MKTCKNKCIFCFISQLPENLRPSLYIKDDDYLQSYMHGNFITLTNLTEKDIKNIVKFKIGPLYVSIHSFNEEIRNKLFGNNKNINALENLKVLDNNAVRTNIQIVLCPGINDMDDLQNTLDNLIKNFKKIQSIGIVPVGITGYNKNKDLKSYDKNKSKALIKSIEEYKQKNIKNKNIKKIYLSDEFYIMAEKEFPDYKDYGRFLQIQNGIGKSADFLNKVENKLQKKINLLIKNRTSYVTDNNTDNNILIITSEYGKGVLEKAFNIINDRRKSNNLMAGTNANIRIAAVKNNFFGGNVKTTGLLTGTDIIKTIEKLAAEGYRKILIPDCIFNNNGLTLDDYKVNSLKRVNSAVKIINESADALLNELFCQN